VTEAGGDDFAHAARLAALAALDADSVLRDAYALKGGLVLHHVYGCPRVSEDLDFNLVEPRPRELSPAHRAELRDFVDRLRAGIRTAARAFVLDEAGVRIERWSAALPTVFCSVWYRAPAGAGAVEMQATLSEVLCGTHRARIEGISVLVTRLEDAVADKLKVLLQTVPRHQVRPSDVFDLWWALEHAPLVPDPKVVGECLLRKAAPWEELHALTPARFRAPAVHSFAEAGYRRLRVEQPGLPFAPFDEVWERILALVDELGLEAGRAGVPAES
jgi:hypothetical protein